MVNNFPFFFILRFNHFKGGGFLRLTVCLILIIIIFSLSNQIYAESSVDKTLHFSAGIALVSSAKILKLDDPINYALLAGASKELYDYYAGGTIEFRDLAATMIGGYVVELSSLDEFLEDKININIYPYEAKTGLNYQF